MSVNQKVEAMREARGQFSDKQAEFEAYAAEFAAGVDAKRDTSELSEARASFQAELERTDGEFRAYADEFDDELARFDAAVDERVEAIDAVRDRFAAYSETFESDVHAIQDVDGLLDAIAELGAEMAATETMFDEYADRFADDVVAIQDISELVTAIEALRTEFADVSAAFEGYAETFNGNVSDFNADIADQSDAFAAAAEAFAEYGESFHEMKVQPMVGDIDAFCAEFSDTEAEFRSFVKEFYGGDETANDTSADTTDVAETGTTVPVNDPSTASDDAGDTDGGSPDEESADTESSGDAAVQTTADSGEDDSAGDSTAVDVDPVSEGMVRCLICDEYYQAITEPHLQTHDMSIQDYRKEYGEEVPLRPENKE
ncbi:gas vesicle protein GvpC [Halorubrum sp. RMP-47]|uniref:Gas vesicle protein GvpC n=1 Tax=Halorubrum miltondacostae TaxID=3076378 RepID=A0ABD5M6B7_9EURY